MLTRMRIRNFKGFGPDADWFPLGELTLILGPNSSGKSSIVQALLLLAQSWSTPRGFLELVPDGDLITLGHLSHVQHYGSLVPIALAFELQGGCMVELFFDNAGTSEVGPLRKVVTSRRAAGASRTDELHWVRRSNASVFDLAVPNPACAGQLEGTEAEVEFNGGETAKWLLLLSQEAGDADDQAELKQLAAVMRGDFRDPGQQFEDDSSLVEPIRFIATLTSSDDVRLQLDFTAGEDEELHASACVDYFNSPFPPPEDLARFALLKMLLFGHWTTCVWALRNHLLQMAYLGPLREPGRRVYQARTAPSGLPRVGKTGSELAHVLARYGKLIGQGSELKVIDRCNELLARIGVRYRLRVDSQPNDVLPAAHQIRLELVKDEVVELTLDLCDVGFGVSQLLPIVVQYAGLRWVGDAAEEDVQQTPSRRDMRLLLIEQPELHLHPAWQAELTSMLLDCWPIADSVDKEAPFRVQSIVECHSELMVLRLSRLMRARSGAESPKGRFKMLAVRQKESDAGRKTVVKEVAMQDNGFFRRREFADEFFASRYDEEGM